MKGKNWKHQDTGARNITLVVCSTFTGIKYMFDGKLVTVWSAPNYCYRAGNVASILCFTSTTEKQAKLFDAVPDDKRIIPPVHTTPYFLWMSCKAITTVSCVYFLTVFSSCLCERTGMWMRVPLVKLMRTVSKNLSVGWIAVRVLSTVHSCLSANGVWQNLD